MQIWIKKKTIYYQAKIQLNKFWSRKVFVAVIRKIVSSIQRDISLSIVSMQECIGL